MPSLAEHHRRYIIELLEQGQDIPPDYKNLLFPPERQEYELVYAGKEREEDILAETMAVPLQPVKSLGETEEGEWRNMLIFGDNLQAMKTLLQWKAKGRLANADGSHGIRLIYIDPPFATKREFQGNQNERAYQDKVEGARFIEFLRKRLVFLREMLTPDGTLYIHLDYRKIHYIKIILDELFGETRLINQIIWKRTSAHSDSRTLGNSHDVILHYAKSDSFLYIKQYTEYSKEYIRKYYRHSDEKGRFLDRDLTARGLKGRGYQYKWKGIDGYWRCPIETMEKHEAEGLLYYTREGMPRLKQYLHEKEGKPLQDVWTDINAINSQAIERIGYPTQKPESLLARIIQSSSNPGDIVLDAFAGSGTTLAVAEKLGRRWIGIDSSKLAIYTIQKRLLNLREKIGNKGKRLKPRPFTLYNAGLYDFSRLKELPWEGWRSYALGLFQCRDEPHTVGGVELDGYRGADDVLVFNHRLDGGVVLDYGFIDNLHNLIGGKVGSRFFIIAPAASVTFLEDYIDKGHTRYYILRIPYSIINELHNRDFEALSQPADASQVNEMVDAVGFDFIRLPEVECEYLTKPPHGGAAGEAVIRIKTFKSKATVKGAIQKGNRETLSMVMVDYDYDGEVFDLDTVFYATDIAENDWEMHLPLASLGKQVMIIYMDIYGNEYREIKKPADFQTTETAGGDSG